MDQNDYEVRYVLLTQEILQDKSLNEIEKIILARITGFERFFEAPATTAEFLGTTELVVQRAKRKLVSLGFLEEIGDTGRGKIYRANLWKSQGRYDKKVTSDITKKSQQILPKSHTENKKRIKRESKGEKENNEPVQNSYGREDINELVDLWESETNVDIRSEANQRRQLYNLIRKYGSDRTKTLIRLVGDSIRSGDRFAPQIVKPSDLTGKYGKLERLKLWDDRRKHAKPFGNMTPVPAMALCSLKKKQLPEYEEISDDERKRVSEMFKEAREKILK